jgi:cysteine-rich repeat protein
MQPSIQCGDGRIEGDEQCERSIPCPGTNDLCRNCQCLAIAVPVCGNGTMESDEACETTVPCADPAFLCASCRCIPPVCGDGSKAPGEECDDGNTIDGDGCSAACTREIPTVVASEQLCGNGLIEYGEECDDSNGLDGDGCSSVCRMEIISAPAPVIEVQLPVTTDTVEPRFPLPVSSASIVAGPTPKKSATSVSAWPQRPAASVSVSSVAVLPVSVSPTPTTYPAWQYQAMVMSAAPVSGPVGKTGPASLAAMAAGAAAGVAWMRRRKRPN